MRSFLSWPEFRRKARHVVIAYIEHLQILQTAYLGGHCSGERVVRKVQRLRIGLREDIGGRFRQPSVAAVYRYESCGIWGGGGVARRRPVRVLRGLCVVGIHTDTEACENEECDEYFHSVSEDVWCDKSFHVSHQSTGHVRPSRSRCTGSSSIDSTPFAPKTTFKRRPARTRSF